MTEHRTASREAWLAARLDLLKEEKELTRRSDALARKRQELPWVRINKPYRFETDQGAASLADLFKGRSQLIVYHFMFGPDYKAGCPSCSAIADGFNGIVVHLENHDVAFSAVSRAPLARLQAYKQRMGWTFPWASSLGDDFNFDFNVSFTEEQQRNEGIEFNYTREPPLQSRSDGEPVDAIASRATPDGPIRFAAMAGTDVATYAPSKLFWLKMVMVAALMINGAFLVRVGHGVQMPDEGTRRTMRWTAALSLSFWFLTTLLGAGLPNI